MSDNERRLGFYRARDGRAHLCGAPLGELLKQSRISTPAYFYDLDAIQHAAQELVGALGPSGIAAYALKANSAGSILRTLAGVGTGADVVSGAELELALACGIPPKRIVLSGVAKTDAELDLAISCQVLGVQAESVEEIDRIAARAEYVGKQAPLGLRVNPGIRIDSHAHIATGHDEAKFGILESDLPRALSTLKARRRVLTLSGVSTHVGSMLLTTASYIESARVVCQWAKEFSAAEVPPSYVDFGGGFGIDYGDAPAEPPAAFAEAARRLLSEEGLAGFTLVVEPGRALVAPYGVLVARVIQTKSGSGPAFALIDAGMNDLLRPALYGARHRIEPLDEAPGTRLMRVAGPVCESADDFGVHGFGDSAPEYVVIRDTGAYGFSMASEYNGRPLPAEVFVRAGRVVSANQSSSGSDWAKRRLGA